MKHKYVTYSMTGWETKLNSAGLWTIMRGSAPQSATPTSVLDVDFVHDARDLEVWAATVVQQAWKRWRERMGLLLLIHGLAELGSESVQYAFTVTRDRSRVQRVLIANVYLPAFQSSIATDVHCRHVRAGRR
jgi:hypothetical protein